MEKTIPTTFIAFSIWYGYLCPPRKILGGFDESSKEPVFHEGPPLKKEIDINLKGDPYEKHVLWKIHKHPLIFCVVDIGTHTKWKMQ